MKVTIPYSPRYPQNEIHDKLDSHRFAVLVAHRRMGKTVLAVNQLIKRSITDGKKRGFYAYVAPFRTQAEQIAWGYLRHFTENIPFVKYHEQKLQLTMPNGAVIRIFGADNPDALRGLYFDGCILDEVAQMKPEVWGEIIRPALADRKGWAVFIGTPKGINLFSQTYDTALRLESEGNPDWCAMLYDINKTKALDDAEVESLRAEMSESEFRQEFLCDFNAAADNALIPIDVVREAQNRHYDDHQYMQQPLIFGVDVARFGSDATVIFKRRGLVAFEPVVVRNFDSVQVASMLARMIHEENPDAVFVDAGQGQGVIDTLVRGMGIRVTEVPFGGAATDTEHYANRRIEMWEQMGKWLRQGGAIPPSTVLAADLCAPTYGYTPKGQKILESKDKIKERIGRSTDQADALALTFANPVRLRTANRARTAVYDPFGVFDKAFRG